jgi:hypothetical protein
MSVEDYQNESEDVPPEDDGDDNDSGARKVIGSFILFAAVAIMIFIFPFGNSIGGNVLAAQLTIFGLGVIIFFLSIATFVVS